MTTPKCPYCKAKSILVSGEYIYPHRPDLFDKKFYMCIPCEAYVGTHASTGEPLGTLANAYLRKFRNQAHAAFDPVWKEAANKDFLKSNSGKRKDLGGFIKKHRTAAYARLAELMDIPVENCHIGCFDATQCRRVIDLCNSREIHRSR
jgi:CO dehydrogenase/acetyl-CoA synthase beta subunit